MKITIKRKDEIHSEDVVRHGTLSDGDDQDVARHGTLSDGDDEDVARHGTLSDGDDEDVVRHGTRQNNTRQGQTITLSKDAILT